MFIIASGQTQVRTPFGACGWEMPALRGRLISQLIDRGLAHSVHVLLRVASHRGRDGGAGGGTR